MVALWNRETVYIFMLWFVLSSLWPPYVIGGHYIFVLWFVLSFFFFFFFFLA